MCTLFVFNFIYCRDDVTKGCALYLFVFKFIYCRDDVTKGGREWAVELE